MYLKKFSQSIAFALGLFVTFLSLPNAFADLTYDFGFRGFSSTPDDGFVFQDGEAGEEGGQFSPFTFGTTGNLTLFGNVLELSSGATNSGPSEETWTFSLTAADGGDIFDPTAEFADVDFWAFRTIGIGAEGTSAGGLETNPIITPNLDLTPSGFSSDSTSLEILNAAGDVLGTRAIFAATTANGTRLHASYSNAATSEIVLTSGPLVGATEIRVTYQASIVAIPEPSSTLLIVSALTCFLSVRRRSR